MRNARPRRTPSTKAEGVLQLISMLTILLRLMREDAGQDVIEYAMLTAGIGIVSVATWPLIETGIVNVYRDLDADTQAIWEVPDPGSN